MTLIRVEHVDKSFASRHGTMSIMQDISFEVKDSDFLAIVGPSGCGKSTLLRLIQGLDQPTAGHIFFRDQPVVGVCSQMAMVFQSFALYPWLTVSQNVAFGLEALHWPRERIAPQVERYVSVTGLDGFQDGAGGHQFFHGVVVDVQRAVHGEMSDLGPDRLAGAAATGAGRELAEVQSLGRGHELDA